MSNEQLQKIAEMKQVIEELHDLANGWKDHALNWKGLYELCQKENEFLKNQLLEIKSECYQHITHGT